ncbi:MAG: hypothetical protein ABR907_11170 [Terracidiphilus sp.]|jgi:hypothetical protein
MSFSCRFAFLLALSLAALTSASAQTASSSSAPAPDQAQASQSTAPNQGSLSVQARIRARRAQRRAAAIHDAYSHAYEAYAGMGYLRFGPGPGRPASDGFAATPALERAHEYAWNAGFTRYFDERLGVTLDGRGYYATAYLFNNQQTNSGITNPAISQYAGLLGPTYRFYAAPRVSVSLRGLAGVVHGNFSGDIAGNVASGNSPNSLGLWPDGYTFMATAGLPVEYNMTPTFVVRVVPEYVLTGFGSTTQNSLGFTIGAALRFGKQ